MSDQKKIYIFLDLDGVMADFDRHAREQGKMGANGKPDYSKLDFEWWVTMPVCEGARDFYDAVTKMGVVKFLTGPIPSVDCFSGKAAWVMKFLPERGRFILKDLIICSSEDKHLLAGSKGILIDDRELNIKDWVAAGGIGIHHKGDFKETMRQLQAILSKLKGPAPAKPVKPAGPK